MRGIALASTPQLRRDLAHKERGDLRGPRPIIGDGRRELWKLSGDRPDEGLERERERWGHKPGPTGKKRLFDRIPATPKTVGETKGGDAFGRVVQMIPSASMPSSNDSAASSSSRHGRFFEARSISLKGLLP